MRGVGEFDSPEKTHDNGGLISLPLASPVGTRMVEGSSGSGSVAFRQIDLFGPNYPICLGKTWCFKLVL